MGQVHRPAAVHSSFSSQPPQLATGPPQLFVAGPQTRPCEVQVWVSDCGVQTQKPPAHVPGSPSVVMQAAVLLVATQPVPATQLTSVHTFPSSGQTTAVVVHFPPWQTAVLQASPPQTVPQVPQLFRSVRRFDAHRVAVRRVGLGHVLADLDVLVRVGGGPGPVADADLAGRGGGGRAPGGQAGEEGGRAAEEAAPGLGRGERAGEGVEACGVHGIFPVSGCGGRCAAGM